MKVQLQKNVRLFETDDSDFMLRGQEVKELPSRMLKSKEILYQLYAGKMRVVEGECEINYKNAKLKFSGEHPNLIHGVEFGKTFVRNLDEDTIVFTNEAPKDELAFDLNGDGVVDAKDRSLAGKLLASNEGKNE